MHRTAVSRTWFPHHAVAIALFAASACAALAAQQKAVEAARSATYQMPPQDVYQETYALLSGSYAIAKESESRGYIETEWKEDADLDGQPTRTRVTAEVLGEDRVRVVLRVTVEIKVGDEWKPDQTTALGVEDDLYVTLHQRLQQRGPQAAA